MLEQHMFYAEAAESNGDYFSKLAYTNDPPASIETIFSAGGSFRGGGELYRNGLETAFGFDYGGTVTVALAAPEPDTWLLMAIGFGGLGLAARARRLRHDGGVEV